MPDELTPERAEELLAQPGEGRELGDDPETGRPVLVRSGRYGPYVTEELPEDSDEKPRTASLLRVDVARRRSRSRTRCGCCRCRGSSARADGEEVLAAQRPLRAVHREGQGDAVARERGADLHARRSTRRSRCSPRRSSAAGGVRPRAPLRELGRRPLVRASSCRQGRPIWSVRDRRRDEREPAGRGCRRVAHPRPGGRAARRAPRRRGPAKKRATTARREVVTHVV